jgi:uncharacterized protein YdaU (DUF1376 family)
MLLAAKADVAVQEEYRTTTLHLATEDSGMYKVVEMFLAVQTIPNNPQQMALSWAKTSKKKQIVETLKPAETVMRMDNSVTH